MVDFQSRDTRRGPTDEEDDDDGGEGSDQDTADEAADDGGQSAGSEATADEAGDEAAPTTDDDPRASDSGADTDPLADDAAADSDPLADDAASDSDPLAAGETDDPDSAAQSGAATDATAASDAETGATDGDTESDPSGASAGDSDPTAGPGRDAAAEQRRETGADATDRTASGEGPATSKGATGPAAEFGTDQGRSVGVAVVTVGMATDQGDPTAEHLETALEAGGHTVTTREHLRGDYDGVQQAVDTLVGRADVDVVVTAGGIGVAQSESTLEAVHPLFEKALPGFEEVYRSLLFERMGTGVITVRTTAGIADGTPVFCLPSDPDAASLAVDEIIAPEAGNIVADLQ